jgi:hypothetical protein
MSEKDDKALLDLSDLLHEARVIIDEQGLYDIWENIPRSSDPDFGKHGSSFYEAVKQNRFPGTFQKWSDKVEDVFFEYNLDHLKFKYVAESGDPRKLSQQHAAKFLRKVRALENIIDEPGVFKTFKTKKPLIQSWPPVEFVDGIVTQGNRKHKFNDEDYVKLINALWKNRRFESPSKSIVFKEGKPISRKELNRRAKIRDHARFKDMVTGVHKLLRDKRIGLKITYPDQVCLVVTQDRL